VYLEETICIETCHPHTLNVLAERFNNICDKGSLTRDFQLLFFHKLVTQ
jgi:hypothetical protein